MPSPTYVADLVLRLRSQDGIPAILGDGPGFLAPTHLFTMVRRTDNIEEDVRQAFASLVTDGFARPPPRSVFIQVVGNDRLMARFYS